VIGRLARCALVGAVTTSFLLTGTGAAEATERITKRTCRADGGTFSTTGGYRECTQVVTYDDSLGVSSDRDPDVGADYYRGEVESFVTIQYTTVTRQRGNETPAMTGADEILASWTEERCYLGMGGTEAVVDNQECEKRGLLPSN
jgi:hypothetical protein